MDRQKLRRHADRLPFAAAWSLLSVFLAQELFFGHRSQRAAAIGILFGAAMVTTWVMRRVSGMTWREALWPRREQPPPSMASVNELARTGRKIQAMKMYRELAGVDLETAHDAVNAIIAQRPPGEPAARIDPPR